MVRAGETFAHYRILEMLGQGGMGQVFLARDQRLDRNVALKFLSGALENDPSVRQRFPLEARAAAQLDHPFVCKVYETGEVDGQLFIAMEYVEGQTLADRLRQGPVSLEEAAQIGVEIAEALEAAHDHGIVHRDLKPANVMLTARHAKVMDFGLAKFLPSPDAAESQADTRSHHPLTHAGVALGTPAYMSPEQAQGKPVGIRSDIFAFGVLLHEMVTGQHPFRRETMLETVSAILRDEPSAIRPAAGPAPPELGPILRRALAKRPEDRYEGARALADDLRRLRSAVAKGDSGRAWRRRVAAGLGVAVLVLAAWWVAPRRGTPRAAEARPKPLSVLVADFDNATGDEVFDAVLEQAVVIGLEGAPFINAYSRSRAREVAAGIDPKTRRLDPQTARLVAQREGIAALVSGGIERASEGYRVEVTALDSVSGKRLARGERKVLEKDGVLAAIGELVVRMRQDLGDAVPDSMRAAARETFTAGSLEAARLYAQAQELMAAGKWQEAIPVYGEAIRLDGAFGRAYAGLAACHLNLNQTEDAKKQYELAFAHIDRMTDREKHRTRGGYYLLVRNFLKAVEEYQALLDNYPSDPAGPTNLALAHFYARDMHRALTTGRIAVEAYPSNLARANLALYAMYAGDFDLASREADAVLAKNPAYEAAYVAQALARVDAGDMEGALAVYDRLRGVSTWGGSLAATGRADLAMYRGELRQAMGELRTGAAKDLEAGLPAEAARKRAWLAALHLAQGDRSRAIVAASEALAASQRPYILFSAGRVLAAAGGEKRAYEIAAQLAGEIEPEPRSFAKMIESEIRLRHKEPQLAITLLREAVQLVDSWLGRYLLGCAYLEVGAFAEAHTELETCVKRRGEATAVFLDDVPSYHLLPPVYYYLGRAQEGLRSPAAAQSYQRFIDVRGHGEDDFLVLDARRRLKDR